MAHFAQLDSNNIVTGVIVVNDADTGGGDLDAESVGISFCRNHVNDNSTNWKQTSYNENFRGNYAGIGATYMTGVRTLGVASTDIFIQQQPYASWSIGINTAQWYSPIGPEPELTSSQKDDNLYYYWNEANYQADNNTGWATTAIPVNYS